MYRKSASIGGLSSFDHSKPAIIMKKQSVKKLSLGKIKIVSLNHAEQLNAKGGMAGKSADCDSKPFACLSQGAGTACSWDICRF